MPTIDLRRQYKHLYSPPAGVVQLVEVPPLRYLMVDGVLEPGGSPQNSQPFQDAIAALYGAAYTLKFASKLRPIDPVDYPVMPLEGLWSQPGGGFHMDASQPWQWTLMIMQPAHVTEEMLAEALARLQVKRPSPALQDLRLAEFCEGLSLQTMHVGPYADEPATLERMRGFAEANGLAPAGRHHEIYLGDPRRAKPERLKTVLRQPVSRA